MSEIDFGKALPSYVRETFPKLSLQSTAFQQISKVLNVVNARLIKEMANAKKKSLLHASQFAAEKILPKYMLRLAKSNAVRQLALFEIGVLEYNGSTNARKDSRRVSSSKAKKTTNVKSSGKGGKKTTGTKKTKDTKKSQIEVDPVTGLRVKRRRQQQVLSPYNVFKQGISKLHSLSHSYLCIEKDGSQYLSSCLYYFVKSFASKLTERYPNDQVGPVEIRNTLSVFLGPNVFRTAISEGNKCLMLHENDLIKFDARITPKQDPKMFSSPLETHSFRPGIRSLLLNRFARPFTAVDNSSEYVEHLLLEVARLFASEAGGNCLRGSVEFQDENDIKSVMDDILPGELRRHAVARATKALADYVIETSELYHSSMSNGNSGNGFPRLRRPSESSAKQRKRSKSQRKSISEVANTTSRRSRLSK